MLPPFDNYTAAFHHEKAAPLLYEKQGVVLFEDLHLQKASTGQYTDAFPSLTQLLDAKLPWLLFGYKPAPALNEKGKGV